MTADHAAPAEPGSVKMPRTRRWLQLYPVIWALGLASAFWPVTAVLTAGSLRRRVLNGLTLALLAVAVCLLLSSLVGAAAGYASGDRIVGLVANLSIWVGLAGLVASIGATDQRTIRRVTTGCIVLGLIHSVVGVVAVAVYPTLLPVPLLHSFSSNLPAGIAAFTTNELVVEGWLNESVLRTVGTMGNTTWSGAVSAATVLVCLGQFREKQVAGRLALTLVAAIGLVNLYFSFSRATEIALALSVVYIGSRIVWRSVPAGPVLVTSALSAAAVVVVVNFTSFVAGVVEVNDAREGSSETRGAIYAETIRRIFALDLPILGYGMKPREEGLVASVATHSTYLGLTFRAGILGLLCFLVALAYAWRRCRSRSPVPRAIVLFIGIWCIFEDFDAGHLVPVFLALAVGLPRIDPGNRQKSAPPAHHDGPSQLSGGTVLCNDS
ncbi:MAG: O-antigen ligase family protein [Pseudonocardia sp.]|nr:O-antigen ligase family protein [Pseudonocardia sp.]